ncbi:MAG TPA: NINE protein [Saprospiraceae bacterium]|nr:NINE protein [Saprospiraceae bacterium]
MRSKTAAGLFALFLGWAGIHRFYLGQVGLGILYFCLMFFGISFILGIIDAVVFFGMDEETFNRKYNMAKGMVPPIYQRMQGYPPGVNRQRRDVPVNQRKMTMQFREPSNPYKISGIKKYKDFDLEGAIEDFEKGLEIQPQDVSLHFNLACAYSLTEQVDKAYAHLDRAVALGFNDFEKIKTHDDLAYVRIQDRWDDFQKNGYRLQVPEVMPKDNPEVKTEEKKTEPVLDDVLLAQLKRLSELRDRGLLSEQEFMTEKKKLTR